MATEDAEAEVGNIRDWRSIVTLIVFVLTNIIVLFPFHIPVYLPRFLCNACLDLLSGMRIIPPRSSHEVYGQTRRASQPVLSETHQDESQKGASHDSSWERFRFPLNFVTVPIIADLFLLAILAIGRKEVKEGTLGAANIQPIDIMAFFITLAYIAISIDASGLIRYLAFKVLQWGGKVGQRLFFFLYSFFFILGSFIGNDPIILSGTAFLAYMTRVSSNIVHPRAWIHTQFAVANIASAVLVSSNPTNLVLAGAFKIKFIVYTANMIVPVAVTAIVLCPCLLFIIFADNNLIPDSIKMHELPEEARTRKPVNPNIPHARGLTEEEENEHINDEQGQVMSLEEIMNPFIDHYGALFGALIMAATLITMIVLNAVSTNGNEHPIFWITVPAAFVMFCWDVAFGWYHRKETREIARKGRQEVEYHRAERAIRAEDELRRKQQEAVGMGAPRFDCKSQADDSDEKERIIDEKGALADIAPDSQPSKDSALAPPVVVEDDGGAVTLVASPVPYASGEGLEVDMDQAKRPAGGIFSNDGEETGTSSEEEGLNKRVLEEIKIRRQRSRTTLVSLATDLYRWLQDTFPTVTAVVTHLPFALIPFAFAMFILVQALLTKGWVAVFAYGWDHWVNKTGTVGAVGGMGFLSVVLCNFAGTNIGTTILLCRVIQTWKDDIHVGSGVDPISERTFWATVYSMALGVNYGAFSTAFSASLAGLLWRDILSRKHIHVRAVEFARVNLPIIAIAMAVGCTVLIGEVYLVRDNKPYRG